MRLQNNLFRRGTRATALTTSELAYELISFVGHFWVVPSKRNFVLGFFGVVRTALQIFMLLGFFLIPEHPWLRFPLGYHIPKYFWSHCHCTCDPNRSVLFAKRSENYSEHFRFFRMFYSEGEHALHRLRHLNHPISLFPLWGTFGWSHQNETLP